MSKTLSLRKFIQSQLNTVSCGTNRPLICVSTEAFYGCTRLSYFDHMTVPQPTGMVRIGDNAFAHCINLRSLPTIAYYASAIGTSAFWETGISSATLPYALNIPSFAFYGCNRLTYVNLSKASMIGASAFVGCDGLVSLYLGFSSVVSLYYGVTGGFGTTNASLKVYVPSSLVTAYKQHTSWKAISGKIASIPT